MKLSDFKQVPAKITECIIIGSDNNYVQMGHTDEPGSEEAFWQNLEALIKSAEKGGVTVRVFLTHKTSFELVSKGNDH